MSSSACEINPLMDVRGMSKSYKLYENYVVLSQNDDILNLES